jgi:hypothetical protein
MHVGRSKVDGTAQQRVQVHRPPDIGSEQVCL